MTILMGNERDDPYDQELRIRVMFMAIHKPWLNVLPRKTLREMARRQMIEADCSE
jgi:hypothetical protein